MSNKRILAALERGPLKTQVGRKTVVLEKREKTYHIFLHEPGRKSQGWQYQSPIAIERYERLVDLLRRSR